MPPGSPFGPNLRAFVIYLRFMHAISFERLARLMSDLFGLTISEGALVNMLADSRPAFARQKNLIRARLLAGSVLQSDETSVRSAKRTGGPGSFITAKTAASSFATAAARTWSRTSSATSVPPCGSPTATAHRWAGLKPTISLPRSSHPRRPVRHRRRRHRVRARPARPTAAGLQDRPPPARSPTPPCRPTAQGSTPNSMRCSTSSRPTRPAKS